MNGLSKFKRLVPVQGMFVDRPVVLFQSDDWGLVGVRDAEGWDELTSAGIPLGTDPYDFHSLETMEDLDALFGVLRKHRDGRGKHPSVVCNFITANVDFERVRKGDYESVPLLLLAEGLPGRWKRPGLRDAYQRGMEEGLIHAGLHGLTHFCLQTAERVLSGQGAQVEPLRARADMLRTLYRAETPVLYGHTRWLGFEYRDDSGEGAWLAYDAQRELVERAAAAFREMFGAAPLTACAPGYRANGETRRALAGAGVRVMQNGPGKDLAPFRDESGGWMLYRNVALEPGIDASRYGVKQALAAADVMIRQGKPVLVSMHAVNFHSTLGRMRETTCAQLDYFLGELEKKYSDLVYSHDDELLGMMERGNGEGVRVTPRWQWKGY